ncbi:LytR family transcriptional regulator [Salinibacillus xinjiangensis]|uniref:LytR family transcriptional regulator n=2 Tax=Salinibacillus xinjiangensis TaxID=1229268 RepID=A0A6G1X283_9BACI|nr:LytR family transcriptional regulator [Salinibacillus xinjiangensis]
MMNRVELRKKKQRKKLWRRIFMILGIILITSLSYGGYVFYESYQAASKTYDDLGRDKSKLREDKVSISQDPFSVLLMGVESYSSGGGDTGRSDTLMLATFNPEQKNMKLMSIPRDTRVEIAERNTVEKINHAYAYGGKKMTIETVENFLDIPVDYYATVNFDGFKNIVDVLGGIDVNVPFDFQQNSDDRIAEKLQFYEGPMELNGRYALAYARMRLEDPKGDLGRVERQKEVVTAVIDKVTSASTVFKIDDLANELGNNIETNMKISDALKLYKKYPNFSTSKIEQITLEGTPQYIDGVSYYIVDEQSLSNVKQQLKEHLDI